MRGFCKLGIVILSYVAFSWPVQAQEETKLTEEGKGPEEVSISDTAQKNAPWWKALNYQVGVIATRSFFNVSDRGDEEYLCIDESNEVDNKNCIISGGNRDYFFEDDIKYDYKIGVTGQKNFFGESNSFGYEHVFEIFNMSADKEKIHISGGTTVVERDTFAKVNTLNYTPVFYYLLGNPDTYYLQIGTGLGLTYGNIESSVKAYENARCVLTPTFDECSEDKTDEEILSSRNIKFQSLGSTLIFVIEMQLKGLIIQFQHRDVSFKSDPSDFAESATYKRKGISIDAVTQLVYIGWKF